MGLGYVMNAWEDEWVRDVCMSPIRLESPSTTNQIATCKGESYMWRFRLDFRMAIVVCLQTETGILVLALFWHLWCFIYYGWAQDFVDGFQKISEFDNQLRNHYSLLSSRLCPRGFAFWITWNVKWNES